MTASTPARPEAMAALARHGVLAVLRAPDPEAALAACEALGQGGVLGWEITYSTPDAPEVIAELRRRHPEALVGAGTIRRPADVARAAEAGAQFLVSPGSPAPLVAEMAATGLPTVAGALTPTEVMQALDAGAHAAKLFPAALHGPALLRALRGPFPDVAFIPTGGVNADNAAQWFDAGAFALGAGGELCSGADIAAGRWPIITARARDLREAVAAGKGDAAGA